MRCPVVRTHVSGYLDGDLDPAVAREVDAHFAACGECARVLAQTERALRLVSALPRLAARGSIAARVMDRLEVENRGPGLAALFRPQWAARPLIFPSLVPAALVLGVVVVTAVRLDEHWSLAATWRHARNAVTSGTEGNPLSPSGDVSVPRTQVFDPLPDALLSLKGEGSLFVESVVARDGTVSNVKLLHGDRLTAGPLLDVLRRERFEPGRFRGRPVAVSVYRLISRLEVREPLT